MSFDKQARQQAQVLIDALAEAVQAEIKALRAAVESRSSAIHEALARPEQAKVLDRVVQELSAAAKKDADAVASQVRAEVQKQAEAALAAARAENERIRHELEARVADAQKQVEARLAEAQKLQSAQASALAAAQKDLAAARAERDAQTSSLEQLQERFRPMDSERKQLLAARDEANKLLEREAKRATGLTAELDLARRESETAKAEATTLRQQMKGAAPRADAKPDASSVQLLNRVGAALLAINSATSAAEVFEALVEHLGQSFGKTVVFQVGTSGAKAWLGRGLGKATDVSKIAIPPAIDSLLKRTIADRKLVAVVRGADGPPVGLSNSPIGSAVALPVVTSDRVIAVAYAEAEGTSTASWAEGCRLAEILIDHVSRRLTTKRGSQA